MNLLNQQAATPDLVRENSPEKSRRRLPEWMKKTAGDSQKIHNLKANLRERKLYTVCEEARCPNMGECWSRGVATFMIGGDVCTRACSFCSIQSGKPQMLDPHEPENTAEMVEKLGLNHAVITAVARDDVPDEGADHFAQTILAVRRRAPKTSIEVLVPDFHAREECLRIVGEANPNIFNHNIETVRRLTPKVRSKARYDRSLEVLSNFKKMFPHILTKSGIMVGLGETIEEVKSTMRDLRAIDCSIITIGQYLQPTKKHHSVIEYVHPDQFKELELYGEQIGFMHTFSGPFVRSSYMADHQFLQASDNR